MEKLAFKHTNDSYILVLTIPLLPRQGLSVKPKRYPCHPFPCFFSCKQAPWRVRFSESCSLSMKSKPGSSVILEFQGLPPSQQPSPQLGICGTPPPTEHHPLQAGGDGFLARLLFLFSSCFFSLFQLILRKLLPIQSWYLLLFSLRSLCKSMF